MARGTLFLVVGPSGAGKDTLIEAAREARPALVVPRRVVTRAADAGGEEIVSVDEPAFERMAAEGAFLLHWRAHGLGYGIPSGIETDLAAGRDVVINVSRSVIEAARAHIAPLRIIVVTAGRETLAERLAARGRESAEDIARRLARADYASPEGPDVTVVSNDGPLTESVGAFLAALSPVRA